MSDKPKKCRIVRKPRKKNQANDGIQTVNSKPAKVATQGYPESESALPIPCDRDTAKRVGEVIELSYIDYLKQLGKQTDKENAACMTHLHNILSEFLGPYVLVGYMPDDEPVEIMSANTQKDKEAVFERLRKTFMRHMNANTP